MLCVNEVKTPSPVKCNQWNTADVANYARHLTRLIIMYNLTRNNCKGLKKTCLKQKALFVLHLIKWQSRRNNCDIISYKSCLHHFQRLFVCYSKLLFSYSTSKWSSTCPSTSCRLTCGRKSMITMNIATRERSSTRTASLTSSTTRSKRWDTNTS